MRTILLIVLWLAILLVDGLVMPALFHIRESFLVFVFLCALVVVYGEQSWLIWRGLLLAVATELFLGLSIGTVVIGFLAAAGTWHALTRFINLKPLLEEASWLSPLHCAVGLGLLAMCVIAAAGAQAIFYAANPLPILFQFAISPAFIFQAVTAIAVCLFILTRFKPTMHDW